MTPCGYTQPLDAVLPRSVVWALVGGLLLPAAGFAEPSSSPIRVFDPLASLRTEPDAPNSDLRLAELEPPGGEEYLARCIAELEDLVDDELEICQQAGLLAKMYERERADGGRRVFDPGARDLLLLDAQNKGCKARKTRSSSRGKADAVAKKYRKTARKLGALTDGTVRPTEIKQYLASSYDADKFGQTDPTGLYRLRQRAELQDLMLDQATDSFLCPVKGSAQGIDQVEDWRLYAKQSREFGRSIKTGPSTEQFIENVVRDLYLIGTDNTFSDSAAGAGKHDFKGHFLYSRQILQTDDVTTTVVLVERPEITPLVEQARGLLEDYLRIRDFRRDKLAKRPLQYIEAEFKAPDLFAGADEVVASQPDPAERLEALQNHFGAPRTGRTRTKDWKAIEWTGPLTALSETLDAELRIDTGLDGQPMHTVVFNAAGTPLADEACFGKLKMGEAVTVVGKVTKLGYDGAPGSGALRFALEPLVAAERAEPGAAKGTKARTGPAGEEKKEPRRPRSAVTEDGVG